MRRWTAVFAASNIGFVSNILGFGGAESYFKMLVLAFVLLGTSTFGQTQYVTSQCEGIYAAAEVPGSQAQIKVQIAPHPTTDGNLAIAIFRFNDRKSFASDLFADGLLICSKEDLLTENGNGCSQAEIGQYHYNAGANSSQLLSHSVVWQNATSNGTTVVYNVMQSGYYCVYVTGLDTPASLYTMVLEWVNPYGLLPALFYQTLPFFFTLSCVYMLIGLVWVLLCFREWKELLHIQHYISIVIGFLLVEMSFNYGFYQNINTVGPDNTSTVLLALVTILNAARNSIALFMLLIVALGYGVVKPTLGLAMDKCKYLAVAHFIAGVIYGSGALSSARKDPLWILLLVFPISLTMSIFYMTTLQGKDLVTKGLQDTMEYLKERRQPVKLLMYIRLQYMLATSAIMLFGIMILNSVNAARRHNVAWIDTQWKYRWFMLDGLLNLVFLLMFLGVLILWRPTSNNERYGLQQLAGGIF